ncbi:roadblock/LC7 domain-containing protein [Wenzhouxiangella sp. EGI_FJ10305]|uniref:roadblock/LC7 domain-containing protein n=1 Tax=Wenzhouxiangella sp. EGI_FJ10305 TaxID=3243768 RepID=UPI0035DBD4A4
MNQGTANQPAGVDHPRGTRVRSILRGLMGSTDGSVNAAAAITSDGMVIASVLQDGVDADRFAAMSASLLALAEREIDEIQRGRLRQLLIEGTEGAVLLVQAGAGTVLAVSAEPGALMGKVFLEARRAAAELQGCLTTVE